MVAAGLIPSGDRLQHSQLALEATVNADGSITALGVTGSIHKVGAHVADAPACNGWAHWLYQGKPIDDLRSAMRNKPS